MEEAVSPEPLDDSLEPEGRWGDAERARGGSSERCAIVTSDDSTGVVTLSIVNYVVHHSNGRAFERESNQ